jgi:hypothetical protein
MKLMEYITKPVIAIGNAIITVVVSVVCIIGGFLKICSGDKEKMRNFNNKLRSAIHKLKMYLAKR